MLVEYTGNRWPTSGSTGKVADASLGFGLTVGVGFIWVVLPCIDLKNITFLDVPVNQLFSIPEGQVVDVHTDLWMSVDSVYRQRVRKWLRGVAEVAVNSGH